MAASIRHKAIVIDSGKTGEQSKFVDLLTSQDELVHCVARNALKSKKRFSGALEPFTSGTYHVKASARYRPTLEAVDLPVSRFSLSASMQKLYVASYACRWMKSIARDDMSSGQWYGFLRDFLDFLCDNDIGVTQVFWFELNVLTMSGVLGDVSLCPLCSEPLDDGRGVFFDNRDGYFGHTWHEHQVSGEDIDLSVYKIISRISQDSLIAAKRIKLSKFQLEKMRSMIFRLLKIHLSPVPSIREKVFGLF